MRNVPRPTFRAAVQGLLLAAAAFSLVWAATSRSGPGVSPDSVSYLAAAEALHEQGKLLDVDGSVYVTWPPLLPSLIALGTRLGLESLAAARTLNAISYAAAILLASIWLVRRMRSGLLAVAAGLALVGATPVLRCATYVWSESLFVLFTLMALIALDRACATPSRTAVLCTFAASGLAWLTRYVGGILWLYCLVWLLAITIHSRERRRSVLVAATLSAAPIAAWLARNFVLTGRPTGERAASLEAVWPNVVRLIRNVVRWYLPDGIGDGALPVFFLVVAAGVVWILRARRTGRLASHRTELLLAGFTAIYAGVVMMLVLTLAVDGIGHRMLAPMVLPLTCLLFLSLDHARAAASGAGRPRLTALLLVLGVSLSVKPVWSSVSVAAELARDGIGGLMADPSLRAVEGFLRSEAPAVPIYSNRPEELYLSTGWRSRRSPRRVFPASRQPTGDLEAFREQWKGADARLLVWFPVGEPGFFHDLATLGETVGLGPSPVRTFAVSDGRVEIFGNRAWWAAR